MAGWLAGLAGGAGMTTNCIRKQSTRNCERVFGTVPDRNGLARIVAVVVVFVVVVVTLSGGKQNPRLLCLRVIVNARHVKGLARSLEANYEYPLTESLYTLVRRFEIHVAPFVDTYTRPSRRGTCVPLQLLTVLACSFEDAGYADGELVRM